MDQNDILLDHDSLLSAMDNLPYQLKAYYEDGFEELIPGVFDEPENLYYAFEYFMDI